LEADGDGGPLVPRDACPVETMPSCLAERLSSTHWMWRTERALNAVIVPFRRKAKWAATPIEERCCKHDPLELEQPVGEIRRSQAPA